MREAFACAEWASGFKPSCPSSKFDLDFMRINILTTFYELWIKTVPSSVYTMFFFFCFFFSIIKPGSLVIDPTCPSFKYELDIIKNIILTEFHELWL